MASRQDNATVVIPESSGGSLLSPAHKHLHSRMKASGGARAETYSGPGGRSPTSPSSRVARGSHAFDFTAFSNSLPPNTGPPGTATVTSGAGSSSTTNKNLSHVPCKFFKQGICQAGKSCPFSHNLDGTSAADKLPCKYFQKGNCKFGLKCALAHFLPNGTQVNSKAHQGHRRGNSDKLDRGGGRSAGYAAQSYASAADAAAPTYSSTALEIFASDVSSPEANHESLGGHSRMSDPIDIGASLMSLQGLGSSYQSDASRFSRDLGVSKSGGNYHLRKYSGAEWQIDTPSTFSADQANLFSSNAFTPSLHTSSPVNLFMGNGPDLSGSSILPSPQNSLSGSRLKNDYSTSTSPLYRYNRGGVDDSAIEESDEVGPDEDEFYVDYIPASIGNLIFTPQEKQRRESRSQSGTLLSRHNSFSTQEKKPDFAGKFKANDDVFLMD